MRSALKLTFLCAWLLSCQAIACGKLTHQNAAVAGMTRHTIEHEGLEREYFIYLPPGYESGAEYPVVFFLHGYGGSATGTEAETTNGLNRYAAEYGYIVVYPQGTWFMSDGSLGEPWEVTSWNHISGDSMKARRAPCARRIMSSIPVLRSAVTVVDAPGCRVTTT